MGMATQKANFTNKRIVILGLARQGLALARFLVRQGATVVVSDAAPETKLQAELVALGDLPHGSIGYQSIFAAGLSLMLMTLLLNIAGQIIRRRFRQAY